MNKDFDINQAIAGLRSGQPLTGKNGILTPLIKQLTEAALEGEIDSHLAREVTSNRRNGKSKKTVKTLNGSFDLNTPLNEAILMTSWECAVSGLRKRKNITMMKSAG